MNPIEVLSRTSALMLPVAVLVSMFVSAPADARGNDIEFTTGAGEEITIKNGLFGKKTRVVKDRFGNKYESKKGTFGSKETQVSIFGSAANVSKKKGLLGGTTYEGSTILGDKVTTKKGIFGRRTTTIDASGTTKAISALLGSKKLKDVLTGDQGPAVSNPAVGNPAAIQSTPDFLRQDANSNFPTFPQSAQ